jgi:hypothetical protein
MLSWKKLLTQALATALSMLASVPIGELFFFHMILIRKVVYFVSLAITHISFSWVLSINIMRKIE